MDAVRFLGRFQPTAFEKETIEAEIRPRLPPCCQRERISIRVPLPTTPEAHPDNLQWHQDGGGAAGTTQHMVVWASEQPTEIRGPDGSIIDTPAHELVWFDNTVCQHRQPRGTTESRRWFVSIRCSGALT